MLDSTERNIRIDSTGRNIGAESPLQRTVGAVVMLATVRDKGDDVCFLLESATTESKLYRPPTLDGPFTDAADITDRVQGYVTNHWPQPEASATLWTHYEARTKTATGGIVVAVVHVRCASEPAENSPLQPILARLIDDNGLPMDKNQEDTALDPGYKQIINDFMSSRFSRTLLEAS